MIVLHYIEVEGEASLGELGAQLSPRVVQCLVERAAGRVEPFGQHVDRHLVERERDQHLALVPGQAAVDRVLERLHQLARLGSLFGAVASVGHQRPRLRLEHHLAFLPGPPAQTHPRLQQGELVGPGGESARAAVVVELAEDGHQGVIGGLESQVVELLAAYVRQGGASARDLKARAAHEQLVQPSDRFVTLDARGA